MGIPHQEGNIPVVKEKFYERNLGWWMLLLCWSLML